MNIERTFLSPYYSTLNKIEKEKCTTPLLEDFDAEISVYMVILLLNNQIKNNLVHFLLTECKRTN
jgi:hypothetical protein